MNNNISSFDMFAFHVNSRKKAGNLGKNDDIKNKVSSAIHEKFSRKSSYSN